MQRRKSSDGTHNNCLYLRNISGKVMWLTTNEHKKHYIRRPVVMLLRNVYFRGESM